jgi:hypothetical protein
LDGKDLKCVYNQQSKNGWIQTPHKIQLVIWRLHKLVRKDMNVNEHREYSTYT